MSLVKFENVTLFWQNLYKPNDMSGKFQIDLTNLSPKQIEKLEEMELNVRNKGDDRNDFITAKSKYEIRAYDKNGDELRDVTIGNGSKASILFDTYSWKSPTGKKGTSLSIKKLIITDLQEYIDDSVGSFEDQVDEVL